MGTQLEVILTGTGTPIPFPGRAGPGCLVRYGDILLQFDVGRGTAIRLAELGTGPARLSAVFLTHHHSDHLVDLADLVMTRWVNRSPSNLPVVAPEGPSARFARGLLDLWAEELEARRQHAKRDSLPEMEVHAFQAVPEPVVVWKDGEVVVSAISVRHQPIEPAVAYRVDTPAGSVVISGDTRVCEEVEQLATGANVLVHEALRRANMRPEAAAFAFVVDYHADTMLLGPMVARAGVDVLMLTHLMPVPMSPEEAQGFEDDIRAGGFTGTVIVGNDLDAVAIPA